MSFFNKPIITDNPDVTGPLNEYYRNGDINILGRLYEEYVALVYGVCLKYMPDEEQAKDAVMGIFEELVVKLRTHQVNNFRSWLYVLARNYCLMKLRAVKKTMVVTLDDIVESQVILHHEEMDNEGVMTFLDKCMDNLPANQKQSIDLFYLKEKCYKDIAAETGFSLNEVKSYIQNGKRNLKICMEKGSE